MPRRLSRAPSSPAGSRAGSPGGRCTPCRAAPSPPCSSRSRLRTGTGRSTRRRRWRLPWPCRSGRAGPRGRCRSPASVWWSPLRTPRVPRTDRRCASRTRAAAAPLRVLPRVWFGASGCASARETTVIRTHGPRLHGRVRWLRSSGRWERSRRRCACPSTVTGRRVRILVQRVEGPWGLVPLAARLTITFTQ